MCINCANPTPPSSKRRIDAQLCPELEPLPPLESIVHLDLLLDHALVQQDDDQDAYAPDDAHVRRGRDEIRSGDEDGHGNVEGDHAGEGAKREEPGNLVQCSCIGISSCGEGDRSSTIAASKPRCDLRTSISENRKIF